MDQPDLYSTQEGPSSGSPQFLEMRGYGSPQPPPPPLRLIRTPVQGGYPQYHLILTSPRMASLLVPLPHDQSVSLPPKFGPLPSCGVFCLVYYIEQCKTIPLSAQFTNLLIFHIVQLCLFCQPTQQVPVIILLQAARGEHAKGHPLLFSPCASSRFVSLP